jgi:hypothetical protein
VLDALGYTGSTGDTQHNSIVREARLWFKFNIDAEYIFDLAGMDFNNLRDCILNEPGRYR